MADAEELVARATSRTVVVVGGGVAGLVAARECAKVGMHVTLVEAAPELGGAVRRADIDGVTIDAGAESYATRGGHVRALLEELGLADRIVTPAPQGAWLAGIPGMDPAPLPKGGILGIPSNPFQEDVRRIIGWPGAWRAYLDRVRPPLTIGHQHSLGKLVASRMGRRVLDRLVAPVTSGVYSAHPDDVDADVAAPGLNAAVTRVGSLSGAVEQLLLTRAETAARAAEAKAPGSAVEGIAGGMGLLIDALRNDLEKLGAEIRTSSPVRRLQRSDAGWAVQVEQFEPAVPTDGADGDAPRVPTADATAPGFDDASTSIREFAADAVIIAVTEDVAHELLAEHVPALGTAGESPRIEIVTLLVDAPALDSAPRGTGVLTVPGSHTAKALTHATAKWPWLRESAGARHVIRVSFGSQGEGAATAAMDDDAAAALALAEASALLGVPLHGAALLGAHRARFTQSQPASLIGAAARRAEARASVQTVPGLAVVGAWLAGTGLAQVVPDARAEADRLRRALLWG